MTVPAYPSFDQLYGAGGFGSRAGTMQSPSGILDLLEIKGWAGNGSRPVVPNIVVYQDLLGSCRLYCDLGGGRFNLTTKKCDITVAASAFTSIVDVNHRVRSVAFPIAQWQSALDDVADGYSSLHSPPFYDRNFDSRVFLSALWSLWASIEPSARTHFSHAYAHEPNRLMSKSASNSKLSTAKN